MVLSKAKTMGKYIMLIATVRSISTNHSTSTSILMYSTSSKACSIKVPRKDSLSLKYVKIPFSNINLFSRKNSLLSKKKSL